MQQIMSKVEHDKFLESTARYDYYGGGVTNITDNECILATVDEEEFCSLLEANLEPCQTVQSVIQEGTTVEQLG
jgi:hypothetical protein